MLARTVALRPGRKSFASVSRASLKSQIGSLRKELCRTSEEAVNELAEKQKLSGQLTNFYVIEKRLLLVFPRYSADSVYVQTLLKMAKVEHDVKTNLIMATRAHKIAREMMKLKVNSAEFPLLFVEETFKDELCITGKRQIVNYLKENRMLRIHSLRESDAWTQQGVTLVADKICPNLEAIFKHPLVFSLVPEAAALEL